MASPNSFRDPYWSDLASKAEQKYDIPPGLLVSVLTNGERSNADQKSEAKAQTVFQIIPETRDKILKRDGIDAYLNDQNAADAAALVLKDGMNWAKGKASDPSRIPALAAGYYHAGGDTANWGPKTVAYINRVSGGMPAQAPAAPSQSTFDRVSAQMDQQDKASSPMATVLQAYQSGQMSPEDAKAFEGEVKAGRVMLPRGVTLNAATASGQPAGASASGPQALPPAVSAAYLGGRMTPEDRAQVDALVKQGVVADPLKGAAAIPGQTEGAPSDVSKAVPDPTIGERIVGTGEAALNLASGATTGMAGAVKGTVGGMFDPNVTNMQQLSDAAQKGAEAWTFAPRSESGQSQAAFAGNVLSNAVPLAGMTGELASAGAAANALKPTAQAIPQVARNTAATAAENVAAGAGKMVPDVVKAIPEKVGEMLGRAPEAATPTPGTMGSVGAAGVDIATQRKMAAQDLPVPIKLTEGQATRDYGQQRFEGETAKNPEIGAPIRERFNEQNKQVQQNFESFIDSTGAQAPDTGRARAVGQTVDKALNDQMARDKAEVRTKYATARKSDEAKAQVDQAAPVSIGEGETALTSTPLKFINDQPTGVPASALSDAARQYAIKIGVAELDEAGNLVPKKGATVSQMEDWRAAINSAVGNDPAQIRQATILKKLIDGQTEPLAGPLYRDARAARQRLAQNYEDRATINRLMTNKPGTADRRVAFEDVFQHAILDGSLDDVRNVRRVLQRGGEDGNQAWKELQGQTMAHLRDEAFGNMARDSTGNVIVSEAKLRKAVEKLDSDGKLDFIFGKRGAEQMRTLNEVVSDLKNIAPGAVNTSNTASVLAGLVDVALTAGSGGIPMPVASGMRLVVNNIKDRNLRVRVAQALGDAQRKQAAAPRPIKTKKTIH